MSNEDDIDPSNLDQFVYWINERYAVYKRKEEGLSRPWSKDPVFQQTYFCNVHRENDRVTKWIRENYKAGDGMSAFNMMLARFVNKPSSLAAMGWPFETWGAADQATFEAIMSQKGAWGGAYIVSTNGRPVPKHEYISELLDAASTRIEQLSNGNTCLAVYEGLQRLTGLASFLSAQIVADLKNTKGHPLCGADDWWTFVAPGPGSLRGMALIVEVDKVSPRYFMSCIPWLRDIVDQELDYGFIPKFCNQDLQNCLCEFDKYLRVKNGTGRSKRKYAGV